MKISSTIKVLMLAALVLSCNKEDKPADTPETDSIERTFYAKGADISWSTQMEKDGVRFYNQAGQEKECTALMKETGMNSIRLRVWVNPEDGWCGKEDVLEKARRAEALGMKLMIDFHYSDTWADPSNQTPPAAWYGFNPEQVKEALVTHTKDVLSTLKSNSIEVEWVQIGNETNNGMLHPHGKVWDSYVSEFPKLYNAGYWTVKEVYPEAKVILHLSNGQDPQLYNWFFSLINGVKYDMIGMSIYPSWWIQAHWDGDEYIKSHWCEWKSAAESCINNIKSVIRTFRKPVMICETGMPASEAQMAMEAMEYLIEETSLIPECHGIFYWEPEVYGGWKPAYYEELGWNAYDMGAFSEGRPTIALNPFKREIK